ncbi:MAG TPA: hypothetical protein VGX28_15465 [Frankiaceae bacterium]|nr:hypothetical protein [Frankiaceae bacterium]
MSPRRDRNRPLPWWAPLVLAAALSATTAAVAGVWIDGESGWDSFRWALMGMGTTFFVIDLVTSGAPERLARELVRRGRAMRRIGPAAAWRLADLAALIGGRKRAFRREEYRRVLAEARGEPGRAQLRHGVGFVVAAVRMRARDAGRRLGRVLDWFLAKPRLEYASGTAAGLTAAYFLGGGVAPLLGNLENVLAAATLVEVPGIFLRTARAVPPVPRRENGDARSRRG